MAENQPGEYVKWLVAKDASQPGSVDRELAERDYGAIEWSSSQTSTPPTDMSDGYESGAGLERSAMLPSSALLTEQASVDVA
ncbi:MAG: hypothetical protein AAFV29_18975, partial [Myxococcota bacterium]